MPTTTRKPRTRAPRRSLHPGWVLGTDALASFRLVKLLRDDFITEPLRKALHQHAGAPEESKLAYLFQCPWCMSVYFGLGIAIARRQWPGATAVVTHALAVSALTGLLTSKTDAT